jgi:hypothetical protein
VLKIKKPEVETVTKALVLFLLTEHIDVASVYLKMKGTLQYKSSETVFYFFLWNVGNHQPKIMCTVSRLSLAAKIAKCSSAE